MKQLFAYVRVSTAKQGLGVSLQEQRAAIERYAARTEAEIIQWFEERKTAAKAGRPEFARMVKLLRQGKAQGVVIHKIDRSTRNYRDWADIDELIEGGVEVHFANDDLDLRSRGGRLAADIQMVVAVDYIRNLREEALKGIHGRLKQGILPHHAPLGYVDRGAGKAKEIDPVKGPLILHLFELYATGGFTLRQLASEASESGLRNSRGNALGLQQIHKILRNPFYAGVIRSRRFGTFAGAHRGIVPMATFDRVQDVLSGKIVRRTRHHEYLFRRLIRCRTCGRALIGSFKKGHVYYRCSTYTCPTTSLREDVIDDAIREVLSVTQLSDSRAAGLESDLASIQASQSSNAKCRREGLEGALSILNTRLARLTDLLVDGKIDGTAHDERRAALVFERQRTEEELGQLTPTDDLPVKALRIVELAKRTKYLYEIGTPAQKRRLLEIVMSNCIANGKSLEFSLREPFTTIGKVDESCSGGP